MTRYLCHGRIPQAPKFGGNIPATVATIRDKQLNAHVRRNLTIDLIVAATVIGALLAIVL